jgi:inner membrane protein
MSEHVVYLALLAIWVATHALIGYTLGQFLFDRPWIGLVGAIAADLDLLFLGMFTWPFVHRGLTHTLLIGGLATAAVAVKGRQLALAFGVGYASQLLIDTTTPKGVPLFYPLSDTNFHIYLGTTGHSPVPTVAFWIVCLGLLWYYGHLPTLERFTSD